MIRKTASYVAALMFAAGIAALAAPPVRGEDPAALYPWDALLTRIPAARRPPNVVIAVHNGWDSEPTRAGEAPADPAAFAQRWGCDVYEKGSAVVLWERQWASAHPSDVPERWLDALRGERVIGRKSLLAVLDEQPGVEQWAALARLLPEHRRLLGRLIDGKVASSLHFWLRLRPPARIAATRNPAPKVPADANLPKEAGLALAALDGREREALAALLRRYYVAARIGGVPDPPDGDWSRVEHWLRPRVTPKDPMFLYVSSPGSNGDRQLTIRTWRPGVVLAAEPQPPTPIWIGFKLPEPSDIAFPNVPARGEASGWTPRGRLSLTGATTGGKTRVTGSCYTRSLRDVLEELGRLAGEKLAPERELGDRTVTLLLTGIDTAELKTALAHAFQARWRRSGQAGSETLVLELTPQSRKAMADAQRSAVSGDPEKLSNGIERIQLRKDLLEALSPERRAELDRRAADDPEAGIRVSFAEFPPALQRRLADQAHYEGWFSKHRVGLAGHLLVDTGRLDDIQVSFRMENGAAAFWVYRLPLTGGGYLEY